MPEFYAYVEKKYMCAEKKIATNVAFNKIVSRFYS